MPLSLSKLCKILRKRAYVPHKYYSYEGNCIFIEMISLHEGSGAMIYIPSRFAIPINSDSNVIELEYFDLENEADAYAENPERSPEEQYPEVSVDAPENVSAKDHLTDKYKRNISITSGKRRNTQDIKDIVRQLSRLQLCVEGLPYHVAIIQNGYFGFIREGETDTYCFKDFSNAIGARSLHVVATLPLFFEKGLEMNTEAAQISDGIQKILDKNLDAHANYLETLVKRKGNMLSFTGLIQKKKKDYYELIKKYKALLSQLSLFESGINEELKREDLIIGEGIAKDLERNQLRANVDSRLEHCYILKKAVLDEILQLRKGLENVALLADKVLYDNSVMMDKIFKNFDILISLCK